MRKPQDDRATRSRIGLGRLGRSFGMAVFLLSLLAIVVSANYFGMQSPWRMRFDATKTRAYSLSPQTQKLLAELKGDWTIALITSGSTVDRSIRKQIDEVLSRYTAAAPRLVVTRIDTDDPAMLPQYDRMLTHLLSVYAPQVEAWNKALDAGRDAFESLLLFAQQQSAQLEQAVSRFPADDTSRSAMQQRSGLMALLADQGHLVLEEVDRARRTTDGRPIADFEGARSVLAQALGQWAVELDDVSAYFGRLVDRTEVEPAIRQYAANVRQEYAAVAQRLAEVADPLKRMKPLDLDEIGEQLAQGEAAVIIGPDRAAVIPSLQLFPRTNVQQREDGGVTYDQRFRGEQLISAAIRSLNVTFMPQVVFVHAEDHSLLGPRDRKDEVIVMASVLRASRYDVAEWMVARQPTRPTFEGGRPVVWVIVPPPPARSLEPTPAMNSLNAAVAELIADGQPVMLNLGLSLLPKYGQVDPAATLAKPFGVTAQTSLLLIESVPTPDGQSLVYGQAMNHFAAESPVGRALEGQQTYFGMPLPLQLEPQIAPGVTREVIAAVEPAQSRWLEDDWTGELASRQPPPLDRRLSEPMALVVAAERPHPTDRGMQRLIVVGSGGWMASNTTEPMVDLGGGRFALVNPGNHELMLAGVAWLANMDDLIAAGPMGQQVARLRNLSPRDRAIWGWVLIGGVPAACLLLSILVYLARRT